MQYAVVTVGETYHIGDLDSHATMCGQTKWDTMLNQRNKTLVAQWDILRGRSASCASCVEQGSKWQTVNA